MTAWTMRMPRHLRFGVGVLADVEEHLGLCERGEVGLLCDRGVRDAGLVKPVERLIRSWGFAVDVYDGVEAQPPIENVQEAVERAREHGYVAIVAVGGGSVVDAGKVTALLAVNPGSVSDVVSWFGQGFGKERPLKQPLPFFTVPTMLSGADVVPAAVVTDRQAQTKFACWSLLLMPAGTFMDPANTATAPSEVLVDASLDAFSHALEGLTSRKTNPIAQSLALEAAGRIFRALPVLAAHYGDAQAREDLCLGCLVASMVVSNTRAAAIHGLSYPVSSAFPISHGRANALLAPAVVRFNGVVTKQEYKALARSLGLSEGADPAEAIALAIAALNRSLGLPSGLAEVGVRIESIPSLVESAERNRWFFDEVNPRPVSRSDMEALYTEALAGVVMTP